MKGSKDLGMSIAMHYVILLKGRGRVSDKAYILIMAVRDLIMCNSTSCGSVTRW